MIWKSPWGKYIDLDRIVEVSEPKGHSFSITYQLIENPIFVYFEPDMLRNEMESDIEEANSTGSYGEYIRYFLRKYWHGPLLSAWQENKNKEKK